MGSIAKSVEAGPDLLDQYIANVKHLPPAPKVAVQLLALFKDSDQDLDRIIELLSHDPALTAEILRRCNSAFFAGDNPVEDIFEAVSRVGLYEAYCVVVSLFASRALSLAGKTGTGEINKIWDHSVMTAVTASTLARRVGETEALAFTTGLLHDVGKVILATAEPRYAEVMAAAGSNGQELIQAEQLMLGVDHAQLGARLLARWKLPDNVVAAVRHHHDLTGMEQFQTLAAIVHVANSAALGLFEGTPDSASPGCVESMRLLNLKPEDLPGLVSQATEEFDRVKEVLGV